MTAGTGPVTLICTPSGPAAGLAAPAAPALRNGIRNPAVPGRADTARTPAKGA